MFKNILILVIMGTIAMGTQAQQNESSKKFKEVKQKKVSPVINVSAEDLWNIVGPGFADAYIWSTAVDHSAGSGEPTFEGAACSNRACDLNAKGFNKIYETVVEYSDEDRILSYDVNEGLPGFVIYGNNRWRIIEIGPKQSQVEMTITMRMKPFMGSLMGGMFKKNLNSAIDVSIEDLKVYAETGEISKQKKERMAKLAMNN